MKFDFRWNSKSRPLFRILAFLLSLLCLPMGFLIIITKINNPPIHFDSTFKVGISATFTGVIFLVIAIRGRLFKKDFTKIDQELDS